MFVVLVKKVESCTINMKSQCQMASGGCSGKHFSGYGKLEISMIFNVDWASLGGKCQAAGHHQAVKGVYTPGR